MTRLRVTLDVELDDMPSGNAARELILQQLVDEVDELLHPSGFCPLPTPLASNQPWAITATFAE